jgi:hypothetical protein
MGTCLSKGETRKFEKGKRRDILLPGYHFAGEEKSVNYPTLRRLFRQFLQGRADEVLGSVSLASWS